MYRPLVIAVVALVLALTHSTAFVTPAGTQIERLSVDSAGVQANDDSTDQFISPDGRYAVFTSSADNLVPGDTNAFDDVFLADRAAGTIERVNLDSAERELNGNSEKGMVTPDGRYAVFGSYASNAVANDRNATWDVFVRDRQAGTTERVSVSSAEAETNDSSAFGSISADGRYVAFHSWAYNLVSGDDNSAADMFVRDRQAGTTERVSLSSAEAQGSGPSQNGAISRDGRYVGFLSFASNLVAGDTNNTNDAFLRDRVAGTTERISVSSAGAQANGQSQFSATSADGRFIVFSSSGSNLVTGDNNMTIDVFVRDRANSTTERISVAWPGLPPENLPSQGGSISADGRYVTFWSTNSYLVPGDSYNTADVFLRDRQLATTSRLNLNTAGGPSVGGGAWSPMMSDNAMHIVFSSPAGDLVPGDTNGVQDIFVKSGDDDFDNVPDETDNCPNWSNASQGMPAWPVASDDPDCDGTGSVTEADLGTDTEKQCPATTALNDELVDAWPPDFNDNGITNMADVVMVGPKLNEPVRDQETRRFDLNVNDVVSLGDIVLMGAYFNRVCS